MKRKKWNKKGLLGNLIGGFIAILIAVTLIPVIAEKVKEAQVDGSINATSPMAQTLLNLTPVVFGITILLLGIGIAIQALRDVGLGESSDVAPIQIKKSKPKKQTYLQYVQERLAVEREFRRERGIFWWLK